MCLTFITLLIMFSFSSSYSRVAVNMLLFLFDCMYTGRHKYLPLLVREMSDISQGSVQEV